MTPDCSLCVVRSWSFRSPFSGHADSRPLMSRLVDSAGSTVSVSISDSAVNALRVRWEVLYLRVSQIRLYIHYTRRIPRGVGTVFICEYLRFHCRLPRRMWKACDVNTYIHRHTHIHTYIHTYLHSYPKGPVESTAAEVGISGSTIDTRRVRWRVLHLYTLSTRHALLVEALLCPLVRLSPQVV